MRRMRGGARRGSTRVDVFFSEFWMSFTLGKRRAETTDARRGDDVGRLQM